MIRLILIAILLAFAYSQALTNDDLAKQLAAANAEIDKLEQADGALKRKDDQLAALATHLITCELARRQAN